MKNDTFYFSHDYNAIHDPKITKLRMQYGMEGYGVYWALIEKLYNNANALQMDCDCIAFELRVDASVVHGVIQEFDLFEIDGDEFGSLSVERRLTKREAISKKRSESASKRWEIRKSENASAMQVHTKTDANAMQKNANAMQKNAKERKGKESKVKESKEHIKAETEVSADIDFEVVWDLYGKKIKKPRAQTKWKRITKKERELALAHIPTFVQATPEVQFRPFFDAYLNQKRWEDEHLPNETTNKNAREKIKDDMFDEKGMLKEKYKS